MARRFTAAGVTRRAECWAARTTDGVWDFERTEEPGTPWSVGHTPTGIVVALQGTLRACRAFVAAGHADRALACLQAHERGEHAAQRDSWCGRC
jgi:hypothetical protein